MNVWPSYLAFRLYTMNEDTGILLFTPEAKAELPEDVQALARPHRGATPYTHALHILEWSTRRLDAFMPPERKLYRAVGARVCRHVETRQGVMLVIVGRAAWGVTKRPTSFERCAQLL